MSRINYTPGQQQPIVEREDYIRQQQQCSLLTDVCSQMARRWRLAGEPLNKTYSILTDPKSHMTHMVEPFHGQQKIYVRLMNGQLTQLSLKTTVFLKEGQKH